jgi:hypothetical protein
VSGTSRLCPGCGVRLIVRANYRLPTVTCPRCLVDVPNPLAELQAERSCPRCLRGNASHAPQCVFCGAWISPAPAGARPCTVCAEDMPGHAANCPLRKAVAPPPVMQSASQQAQSDGDSTLAPAWVLVFACVWGMGSSFGFQIALLTFFFLSMPLISGPRSGALGRVASTIVSLAAAGIGLAILAFIALWIICASGGARWR